MPVELFRPAWELPPLSSAELGPLGDFERWTDARKAALWDDYRAGRAARVPVIIGVNNRVVLMDPRIDADGLTYERVFHDPQALVIAQLRFQYVLRRRYHVLCDNPAELPACWEIMPEWHNVHDAAALGAPVHFHPRGIPETTPILGDASEPLTPVRGAVGADSALTGGVRMRDRRAIFDFDLNRPLDNPFFRHAHAMYEAATRFAAGRTFLGRPIKVVPYADVWSDGPLTVALNLRGPAILTDLRRDPGYVRELFDFLTTFFIRRRAALLSFYGLPEPLEAGLADDSIALLSPAQYREFVLPAHRRWYDAVDPDRTRKRGMHLCGDATRHFRALRDECGVTSFDTGFPVDFAALRRELGPQVELYGGVEVALLLEGTPDAVYERGRAILTSGVLAGGRFVFREANNLPPGVPWANLAALYRAGMDFGALTPAAPAGAA